MIVPAGLILTTILNHINKLQALHKSIWIKNKEVPASVFFAQSAQHYEYQKSIFTLTQKHRKAEKQIHIRRVLPPFLKSIDSRLLKIHIHNKDH